MAQAAQDDDDEELKFNVEDVQKIVRDNIELCLGGNTYSHTRTPQWITIITDKTLSRLNKLNKPFKYILRVTITQKNGAALHSAAAYYWDVATDGACTVRWENKFMYCIVNIKQPTPKDWWRTHLTTLKYLSPTSVYTSADGSVGVYLVPAKRNTGGKRSDRFFPHIKER